MVPLSFTDCIEACVYLSGDSKTFIDIGLPFAPGNNTMWYGNCAAIAYYVLKNMCQLISYDDCTAEQIGRQTVSVTICVATILN